MKQIKISVIGIGYVGFVTAVCFTEIGNNVFCVDTDYEKIEKLKNSVSTIYEPGLYVLLL